MVPGNDEQAAETSTGFLPAAPGVSKTGGGDLSAPDWKVGALEARPDTPAARLAGRRDLLARLADRPGPGGVDRFYAQAFDTLTSPQVARAFDYKGEPARVRERYGSGHR